MPGGNLGIIEINEAPPPLALRPEEIAALADELVEYHTACADLDSRKEQAHWGEKSLPGLLRPIERTSIEPLALAVDGGDVQALQQVLGQGQWQDALVRRPPWRLGDETLGEADGVYIVEGADVPKHGEHSVGGARQWGGHVGKVDHCHAGGGRRRRPPQRRDAARPAAVSAGGMVRGGPPRAVGQGWPPRRDAVQDEAGPGPGDGAGERDGGRAAVAVAAGR